MARDLEPGLAAIAAAVPTVAASVRAAAVGELEGKTKPRGSLGLLEELAADVAAARGSVRPAPLQAAIVVAAADHGVAAEGVSAYPQEVTAQMVANFASGGAAICVLARSIGAELIVVDAGVSVPVALPQVRSASAGPGTANAAEGPAMSREDAVRCVVAGADLAVELAGRGTTVVALGEMGIANTTVAAALSSALLRRDPAEMCGAGTGVDAAGIERKVAVVRRMLERNEPDPCDAVGCLAAVGGFEIAFLAGVALGAAAHRCIVVLDGFISSTSALAAVGLAPALAGYLVASHVSPEPGHRIVLEALGLRPLLDLGLRLGEGSGAALALPLVAAARDVLVDMATFARAGVTDTGR